MFFLCKAHKMKRKEKSSLPIRINHPRRERMSLSAFLAGSLTVEAACVLPLFVFGMVGMMYLFGMILGVSQLGEALHETGERMAVYAYAQLEGEEAEAGEGTQLLNLVYAQSQIQGKAKKLSNVSLIRSKLLQEDQMIDLVADYSWDQRVPFFHFRKVTGCQRARVRAWVGREEGETSERSDENPEQVYITVSGTVYHTDPECTHIRLSVHGIEKEQLEQARNEDGGKYYPCEICGGQGDHLYITDTGNRYHSSVNCSELKRGVLKVPFSQVKDWSPCQRCGGK